jgi:hypothetical protein
MPVGDDSLDSDAMAVLENCGEFLGKGVHRGFLWVAL